MNKVKSILIGTAAIAGAFVGGIFIQPNESPDAVEGAQLVTLSDTLRPAMLTYKRKSDGQFLVSVDATKPVDFKKDKIVVDDDTMTAEKVAIDSTPKTHIPPRNTTFRGLNDDGEFVFVPGREYRTVVYEDGKILYEERYTPSIANYPDKYAHTFCGIVTMKKYPNMINDTATANTIAGIMGYEIPKAVPEAIE